MYLRWITNPRPSLEARIRTQEIIRRNKEAKASVLRLRKQLAEAAREAEALGLLASAHGEEEEDLERELFEDEVFEEEELLDDEDKSSVDVVNSHRLG